MIGRAVVAGLHDGGYAVDWVRDGAEAELAIANGVYDLALLDLGLPRRDGVEVLRGVRAARNDVPVLVITARDAVSDRVRGLDAGADDYLVKPYDPAELLARLRAVERRRSGTASTLLRLGTLEIDLGQDRVRRAGRPVELTPKEWALLRVLASRPDRIHTREALQDALYGFDAEADSNTLEVFISRLRRKLGRAHIQTLRGLGYRLCAADPDDA